MPPPPITIRPTTAADIPLILSFIKKKATFDGCPEAVEATTERLRQALFSAEPVAAVVIAEVEEKPVGFAAFYPTFSTFLALPGIWLDDLFVDESMRGQGVGKALLRHLAQAAWNSGCGRLEWHVATWNERGIEFYKGIGTSISERARLCQLDRQAMQRFLSITS